MNRLLLVFFGIIVNIMNPALSSAKNVQYFSIDTIPKANTSFLSTIDADSVVFIEIDDVIVTTKSAMFGYYNNPYRSFINSIADGVKNNDNNYRILTNWYKQRGIKLSENDWPLLIQTMQNTGAKVYGLCSNPADITNLEQLRYIELRNLGIGFSKDKKDAFLAERNKWGAIFYQGILFNGPLSKEDAIMLFLQKNQPTPKKIFFINLWKRDLQKIQNSLRIYDNNAYLIEYNGVKKMPYKIDDELVRFQQQKLLKEGVWLEDEAAKLEMKN
jgi:hypothetical protein